MGICETCKNLCPSSEYRQSGDFLCYICENKRKEGIEKEINQAELNSRKASLRSASTVTSTVTQDSSTSESEPNPAGVPVDINSPLEVIGGTVLGSLGSPDPLGDSGSPGNVDTEQIVAENGNLGSIDQDSDGDDGPRSRTCLICAKKFQILNNNTSKDNHNTIQTCEKCSGMSEDISSLKVNFDKLTVLVQTLVNGVTDEMKNIKESNAKLLLENNHLKQANTNLENELKLLKDKMTITGHDCPDGDKSMSTSLLIGSSLIRNIDEDKLDNTQVICMPGAYASDIRRKLDDLQSKGMRYERIYLVMGGNDASLGAEKINLEETLGEIQKSVNTANTMAKSVTVASIPPRLSPEHALENICTLNAHILSLCKDSDVTFAKNDQHFFTRDGQVNDGYLFDGTHLTIKGSNKLAQSLGLSCQNDDISSRKPRQTKCYDHKAATPNQSLEEFSHTFWNTTRGKAKQKHRNKENNGPPKRNTPANLKTTHRGPHGVADMRKGALSGFHGFSQRAPPNPPPRPRQTAIPQDAWMPAPTLHGSSRPIENTRYQTVHGQRRPKQTFAAVTRAENDFKYCLLCGEENHRAFSCKHGVPIKCNACSIMGHKAKFCSLYGY